MIIYIQLQYIYILLYMHYYIIVPFQAHTQTYTAPLSSKDVQKMNTRKCCPKTSSNSHPGNGYDCY